ncbi:MAG: NAD(+)/NADH kinase [Thermoleophilia bacterium]
MRFDRYGRHINQHGVSTQGLGHKLATKIAIITHRRSEATNESLTQVLELCRELGVEVLIPEREVEKYPAAGADGLATVVSSLDGVEVDFCLAMGGDGTILRAFNRFADLQTPILGINFGRMGFLSAIGPEEIPATLKTILSGEYDAVELGLLEFTMDGRRHLAINDVVVHKPDGGSVIHLGYRVNDIEMDSLSCDGLVVATPAGSTAYNLSAGGPLVSLGVAAFMLTAIAPHTLKTRSLVLGPDDSLTITNESLGVAAAIYVDGRDESRLQPGTGVTVTLSPLKASLVQARGAGFYEKLRDKFIRG